MTVDTKTTHTPGPWHTETLGHTVRVVSGRPADGPYGDDVIVIGDLHDPTKRADASLIAAAPELLDALRDLLGTPGPYAKPRTLSDAARVRAKAEAAIRKAEGR